ncbi:hypothetical protein ACFLXC_05010 [Chloroflexota bacterium]
MLKSDSLTDEAHNLWYKGRYNLRYCCRIPINLLHFNIENGRYASKWDLLKRKYPGANITPQNDPWKTEILRLLDGTWEDHNSGANTRADRAHFLDIVEDMKIRRQERPGIVLENGAVVSGNRRLAALITLSASPEFGYFNAFIIPGDLDEADRWKLEMVGQMAPARLTQDYSAVDMLLKIKQGVDATLKANPQIGERGAISAVATEMGRKPEDIKNELKTLQHVEEYLRSIGRAKEWWLIEGKTEQLTEIEPLVQACDKGGLEPDKKAKVKAAVFQAISCDKADNRWVRDVRRAVGPATGNKATGVPEVVELLIKNAPSTSELSQPTTTQVKTKVDVMVQRVVSIMQVVKEGNPLVKAEAAESNLKKLKGSISGNPQSAAGYVDELKRCMARCKDLAKDITDAINRL